MSFRTALASELVAFTMFEGPGGTVSLLELFDGRPQLVLHHFMWTYDFDADGSEHPRDTGCPSCAMSVDGIGDLHQLHVRNTSLVAVTRAPYDKLAAFRERMGWTFPWYSSAGSDRGGAGGRGNALDDGKARRGRASAPSSVSATPSTTPTPPSAAASSSPCRRATTSTSPRLGRQEEWEEPKGRATPLGLQAGGPAVRLPDEYDVTAGT